jgi:precorrin-2 dehydrogenase / sirohydrochlorin ferrochelatase
MVLMAFQPIMIDLSEQKIVIVGGGRVSERRVRILLNSGGLIIIISPEITEGLHSLWKEGKIIWKQKRFEPEDLQDAFVVLAATNNSSVNQWVIELAPPHALVNNVSDFESGNIQFPAHCKRGRLSISISTNGSSPMLSKKIRKEFEKTFPETYGEYVDFLYDCRKLIQQISFNKEEQQKLLKKLLGEEFLQTENQKQILSWLEELSRGGGERDKHKW